VRKLRVTFTHYLLLDGTDLTGAQAYYTGPNGTGTTLAAGSVLTSDQTVYIYDNNGTCDDNESFAITINTTPDFK